MSPDRARHILGRIQDDGLIITAMTTAEIHAVNNRRTNLPLATTREVLEAIANEDSPDATPPSPAAHA